MKNKIVPVVSVLTLIFTLGVSASFAGVFAWNDTNGNWSADSNWQGGTAPSGADNTDVLNFGDTMGTSYTASNDLTNAPVVVNEIAGNSVSHNINLTGNQIQLAGTTPTVAQNGSGILSVVNDLDLAANTTLGGSGSGAVFLGDAISGVGGLTKTSSGTASLTTGSGSSYVGGTIVNAGTLIVDNSAGSGTGTGSVTVNAGATVQGGGTISGAVNVNNHGTVAGQLTVGSLAVNSGGDISPGDSSTGLTAKMNVLGNTSFAPSGKYTFDVNDFGGVAGNGIGWDLLNITGTLDLSALSPSNPFVIQVDSWAAGSGPGFAAHFNQYDNYSLLIATSTGGFLGNFAPDLFTIDTSGFQNPNGGVWTVSDAPGDLELNYTTVPEPSMAMLWLSGCGIFAFRFLLHRRSSAKATAI